MFFAKTVRPSHLDESLVVVAPSGSRPLPRSTKEPPLSQPSLRFGFLAALTVVALRLGVGMHFLSEGLTKVLHPKPFSAPFLGNAKGPLARYFHEMVYDHEGRARLGITEDEQGAPINDPEPTVEIWKKFAADASDHYVLDEEGRKRATAIVDDYVGRFEALLEDNSAELREYTLGLDRSEQNEQDPVWQHVPSLWGQSQTIAAELKQKRDGWLTDIDAMWAGLEEEVNALGDGHAVHLALPRVGHRPLDSLTVDRVIPWFDLLVGATLVVGLFTRLSASLGGLFLASVVASQWPFALGAAPVWSQLVEMLALFALAGIGAGRFAGLDGVLGALWNWCCPPRDSRGERATSPPARTGNKPAAGNSAPARSGSAGAGRPTGAATKK